MMRNTKLGLLIGSAMLFACEAGSISEPEPETFDEIEADGGQTDLASSELRLRPGGSAPASWERLQQIAQSYRDYLRKRRGSAANGGEGGASGTPVPGGSGSNTAGKGGSTAGTAGKGGSGGTAGKGGSGGSGGSGGTAGKGGSGGSSAGTAGKGGSGGSGGSTGTAGKGGSGSSTGTAGKGGSGGSSTGTAGKGGSGGIGGSTAGTGSQGGTGGTGSAVGIGDIDRPVNGPPPTEAARIGGAPFRLVKNWDFGASGTIRNIDELSAEFEYRDQFGTIANGTHYGAVIVAPNQATVTATNTSGLNLPNNRQPVEDPARPYREFGPSTLKTYVRPLDPKQTTVSVNAHNAGCGSFMAKWSLPAGGDRLGSDIVWETRVRIPKPLPAYWFALWTSGDQWNGGAEMDLVEAFGASHIFANAFHSDSVGGVNNINYSSWPNALSRAGVPEGAARDLRQWHIWTWVYHDDNSYEAYYDGHVVQYGTIEWTNGGKENGTPIDMRFLFDFGWGHTDISDVNITLPASDFPMEYEIDYSRVYLR